MHKARKGSGHSFRIDIAKDVANSEDDLPRDIIQARPTPYDAGMRDSLANERQVPTTSSELPRATLEKGPDIVLSAQAGRTSEWIFLAVGEAGSYLIFNPETNSCLIQEDEKLLARDIRQVCEALHDFILNGPDARHDVLEQEWQQSIWKIQLWDKGPKAGKAQLFMVY